jgi:hypothetical protein
LDVKIGIDMNVKTPTTSISHSAKSLGVSLLKCAQSIWLRPSWRNKPMSHQKPLLTAEQIEIRIWGFVVIIVMLVFAGITASMLYSVIFVTQPIKSMAPIDQAFTKMLNDIVLLIVGGIGGIMSKRAVKSAAEMFTQTYPPSASPAAPPPAPVPSSPAPQPVGQPFGGLPAWVNPPLDESWTPGPPPSTPGDYLHPEREDIASERQAARTET